MTAEEIDLRIESYWTSLKYGTDDQRKRALGLLIVSVHRDAWHEGLKAGHEATMAGARQAIGHPATDPANLVPAILGAKL